MAERAVTMIAPGTSGTDLEHATLVTWTGLLNGDTGAPVSLTDFPDRTVQVSGTFGVGGTVVFEGSNNGTAWSTLTDPQGNAISKTSAAVETVTEVPRYVRPQVTAGDGSTSLTVTMLARSPR